MLVKTALGAWVQFPTQLPANVETERQQWWLKVLGPCHSYRRLGLSSQNLTSADPVSTIVGISEWTNGSEFCLPVSLFLMNKCFENVSLQSSFEAPVFPWYYQQIPSLFLGNATLFLLLLTNSVEKFFLFIWTYPELYKLQSFHQDSMFHNGICQAYCKPNKF